jgi:hypothetical protein
MKQNQPFWRFLMSGLPPRSTPHAPAEIGAHRLTSAVPILLALTLITFSATAGATPLVIHEWGTFTSLQDENGQAIGGINADDEPVPAFVHHAGGVLVFPATEMPNSTVKGFPRCDTDVTMRLETPVLYFHPAAGTDALPPVTVSAAFHGGILSEFYPQANTIVSGTTTNLFTALRSTTVGTLTWPDLAINTHPGTAWPGPDCTNGVWTSPRAVAAADVRATNGEAERFLFYRGVAHLDSPVSVTRHAGQLTIYCSYLADSDQIPENRHFCLVDIAPDGTVAFRTFPGMALMDNGAAIVTTPATFPAADYSTANRAALRTYLHDALVKDGLFADEADALLNTWQASYFKSPGLRLFFLVPRTWTDTYLPLKVSAPADITRVMVGRVEIVTPAQRQTLATIAQTPAKSIQADAQTLWNSIMPTLSTNAAHARPLLDGTGSFKSLGIPVPPLYQSYLDLGRFRNALVLEAARENPTPSLNTFIAAYGLRGYAPAGTTSPTVSVAY